MITGTLHSSFPWCKLGKGNRYLTKLLIIVFDIFEKWLCLIIRVLHSTNQFLKKSFIFVKYHTESKTIAFSKLFKRY